MERKRIAEQEVEENRPKKRRKTKYPRLEAWGEYQEQEQEMDAIITIQDYVYREGQVGSRQDTTPVPPKPVQVHVLLDPETDTLLNKSRKLQERKMAISTEVQKKKFKFNTRGKLRKDEIQDVCSNPICVPRKECHKQKVRRCPNPRAMSWTRST
mgnify:CR=1 FL=1